MTSSISRFVPEEEKKQNCQQKLKQLTIYEQEAIVNSTIPNFIQVESQISKQNINMLRFRDTTSLESWVSLDIKDKKAHFSLDQNLYEGILGIVTLKDQRIFYFKNKVDSGLIQQFHMPTDLLDIKICFDYDQSLYIIILSFKNDNSY